jgi:predicted ABC-type exoprotein transport system permease subunit
MTLNYTTNKSQLIKDYRKFLFRKFLRSYVSVLAILLVICFLLLPFVSSDNRAFIEIPIFMFSGVLLVNVYMISRNMLNINKHANQNDWESGTITFGKTKIEIVSNHNSYVIFTSQIQNVLRMNNVVFVEETESKLFPVRLSKAELGDGGFNGVLDYFKINESL